MFLLCSASGEAHLHWFGAHAGGSGNFYTLTTMSRWTISTQVFGLLGDHQKEKLYCWPRLLIEHFSRIWKFIELFQRAYASFTVLLEWQQEIQSIAKDSIEPGEALFRPALSHRFRNSSRLLVLMARSTRYSYAGGTFDDLFPGWPAFGGRYLSICIGYTGYVHGLIICFCLWRRSFCGSCEVCD